MVDRANKAFAEKVARVPALFAALKRAAPFAEKGVVSQAKKSGVYAFFENGVPVHVGRTRNLQSRLRSHVSATHNSASFTFNRARKATGRNATYKSRGSRADLMRDAKFAAAFKTQRARTKSLEVRFVEVSDPILQYLLELYACLEWGLPLDEFDTH